MKKTVFLILSVMTIFLSACTGPSTNLLNPLPPAPLNGTADRGLFLPISDRSSISIDVECILDYVQGETSLVAGFVPNDAMNPWISWSLAF